MKYSLRIFLGFALITAFSYSADAQKLNNIQEGSVSAPAEVKADGKLKEWTNSLQAYNKSKRIHFLKGIILTRQEIYGNVYILQI